MVSHLAISLILTLFLKRSFLLRKSMMSVFSKYSFSQTDWKRSSASTIRFCETMTASGASAMTSAKRAVSGVSGKKSEASGERSEYNGE